MITQKEDQPEVISHRMLRRCVGWIAITLPFVLAISSIWIGDCTQFQQSISEYYHTKIGSIFVGALFSVALFLYSYKGYDYHDNLVCNLAAIFALGVALFPTSLSDCPPECAKIHYEYSTATSAIHFTSAALLFLTLAYISYFLFTKSKPEAKQTAQKIQRNKVYKRSAFVIIFSLISSAIYFKFFESQNPDWANYVPIYWLESLMLVSFGIAWLTKGEAILSDK